MKITGGRRQAGSTAAEVLVLREQVIKLEARNIELEKKLRLAEMDAKAFGRSLINRSR